MTRLRRGRRLRRNQLKQESIMSSSEDETIATDRPIHPSLLSGIKEGFRLRVVVENYAGQQLNEQLCLVDDLDPTDEPDLVKAIRELAAMLEDRWLKKQGTCHHKPVFRYHIR